MKRVVGGYSVGSARPLHDKVSFDRAPCFAQRRNGAVEVAQDLAAWSQVITSPPILLQW